MEKKSVSWSSILLIIVSVVMILGILERYSQKPKEVIREEVRVEYVRDTVNSYIPYDRLSKETIVIDSSRVNYDSLIAEAFKEWQTSLKDTTEKTFVVKADTTIDSLVTAEIAFYSPLPIHPKSYFQNRFTTKIPVITKTVTVTQVEYTSPILTYGLTASVGYGFISQKPDVFIGAGIFLNVGKIL